MSKGFNGSIVLTQHSTGVSILEHCCAEGALTHTSFQHASISAASTCIAQAVRAYSREAKLPQLETICEVKGHMFPRIDQSEFSYSEQEWF